MTQRKPAASHKRAYDSGRRRERARHSRDRILDSAERHLLRDGYGPTTIATIAADAGVSPDTIYKSFGGKPGIVRAIRNRALEGEGAVTAERRSDALHEVETDPRRIIEAWGTLTAEVTQRVAPILLLIRAAASADPEVLELLEEMDEARLGRMTLNARRLHEAGHLRNGITITQAADVLWTYSAPELYELIVLRRGWSAKRHGQFVADAIANALL